MEKISIFLPKDLLEMIIKNDFDTFDDCCKPNDKIKKLKNSKIQKFKKFKKIIPLGRGDII